MRSGECEEIGMLNWLSQVLSVAKFGVLSIPHRLGSGTAALFGIAGVVGVLVSVLSMAVGFKKTMLSSGAPNSAIVLSSGGGDQMASGFAPREITFDADAP